MSAPALVATHDDEPAYDLVPATAEPRTGRPRVLLVGTALAGGSIVMLFAGLLGIYLHARHAVISGAPVGGKAPVWFAEGNSIPLTPANIAMGTMILSCVSMAWAVYSVKNNDRQSAYFALGLTILFGFAVINANSFLYSEAGIPITSETSPAGLLFYAVTGASLVLIVGALVFATIMTFRTLGGEYSGRDRDGIVAASMIWYLTTAIYGAIWYAVYVAK